MAELGNPHNFVPLDTKILAQLSKVAKGELARQILTFKDTEAQSKRVVRGRQVLLMFEQYFKTNEEAGALYGTEDLLQVRLHSDDLKSFLQNWDAVIAGMKRIPDENTKIFLLGSFASLGEWPMISMFMTDHPKGPISVAMDFLHNLSVT